MIKFLDERGDIIAEGEEGEVERYVNEINRILQKEGSSVSETEPETHTETKGREEQSKEPPTTTETEQTEEQHQEGEPAAAATKPEGKAAAEKSAAETKASEGKAPVEPVAAEKEAAEKEAAAAPAAEQQHHQWQQLGDTDLKIQGTATHPELEAVATIAEKEAATQAQMLKEKYGHWN